jgi:hypothetical protein
MTLTTTKIRILGLLLLASLSACDRERPTYSYLMRHPDYLQQVYNGCVEQVVGSAVPCDTVMRAQADFTQLVNERAQNPERFGARVLQAQENTVYLRQQFEAAWKAYNQVGSSKSKLEELKNMRIELDKRENAYRASELQVKILLTVIAATSSV